MGQSFAQRPERRETLLSVVRFKIQPEGGGVPITRGGRVIGAIGVAGVVGEKSEQLAITALG
jgi:uncharacterized protein GlcG (DUF336 family)